MVSPLCLHASLFYLHRCPGRQTTWRKLTVLITISFATINYLRLDFACAKWLLSVFFLTFRQAWNGCFSFSVVVWTVKMATSKGIHAEIKYVLSLKSVESALRSAALNYLQSRRNYSDTRKSLVWISFNGIFSPFPLHFWSFLEHHKIARRKNRSKRNFSIWDVVAGTLFVVIRKLWVLFNCDYPQNRWHRYRAIVGALNERLWNANKAFARNTRWRKGA